MSVNITVNGKFSKHCGKSSLLEDPERKKKELLDERKKERILQVRAESKNIAQKIRTDVAKQRGRLQKDFEQQCAQEQERLQRQAIAQAHHDYRCAIFQVGTAHRAAAMENQKNATTSAAAAKKQTYKEFKRQQCQRRNGLSNENIGEKRSCLKVTQTDAPSTSCSKGMKTAKIHIEQTQPQCNCCYNQCPIEDCDECSSDLFEESCEISCTETISDEEPECMNETVVPGARCRIAGTQKKGTKLSKTPAVILDVDVGMNDVVTIMAPAEIKDSHTENNRQFSHVIRISPERKCGDKTDANKKRPCDPTSSAISCEATDSIEQNPMPSTSRGRPRFTQVSDLIEKKTQSSKSDKPATKSPRKQIEQRSQKSPSKPTPRAPPPSEKSISRPSSPTKKQSSQPVSKSPTRNPMSKSSAPSSPIRKTATKSSALTKSPKSSSPTRKSAPKSPNSSSPIRKQLSAKSPTAKSPSSNKSKKPSQTNKNDDCVSRKSADNLSTCKPCSIVTLCTDSSSSGRVQFYDYNNKYTKAYPQPATAVHVLPPDRAQPNAMDEARIERQLQHAREQEIERLKKKSEERGQKALEREQVRRDCDELTEKLDALTKQHAPTMQTDTNMVFGAGVARKETKMNAAIEEILMRPTIITCPEITRPAAQQPCKMPASCKPQQSTAQQLDPSSLNLGATQVYTATIDLDHSSPSSESCRSILLGYVNDQSKQIKDDINQYEANPQQHQQKSKRLQNLLKRINKLRDALLSELQAGDAQNETENIQHMIDSLCNLRQERESIIIDAPELRKKSSDNNLKQNDANLVNKQRQHSRSKEQKQNQRDDVSPNLQLQEREKLLEEKEAILENKLREFFELQKNCKSDMTKQPTKAKADEHKTTVMVGEKPLEIVVNVKCSNNKKSKLKTPRKEAKTMQSPNAIKKKKSNTNLAKQTQKVIQRSNSYDSHSTSYRSLPQNVANNDEGRQKQASNSQNIEPNSRFPQNAMNNDERLQQQASNSQNNEPMRSFPQNAINIDDRRQQHISNSQNNEQQQGIISIDDGGDQPLSNSKKIDERQKILSNDDVRQKSNTQSKEQQPTQRQARTDARKNETKKPPANVNPLIAQYIQRLLGMSRNSVDALCVSSSDIDTPSSSIMNNATNKLESSDSERLSTERLERVQQFITDNYSFVNELENSLKTTTAKCFEDCINEAMNKIWKKRFCETEKKDDTPVRVEDNGERGQQQDSSSILRSSTNQTQLANDITNRAREMTESLRQDMPQERKVDCAAKRKQLQDLCQMLINPTQSDCFDAKKTSKDQMPTGTVRPNVPQTQDHCVERREELAKQIAAFIQSLVDPSQGECVDTGNTSKNLRTEQTSKTPKELERMVRSTKVQKPTATRTPDNAQQKSFGSGQKATESIIPEIIVIHDSMDSSIRTSQRQNNSNPELIAQTTTSVTVEQQTSTRFSDKAIATDHSQHAVGGGDTQQIQRYAQLTDNCNQRISELTELINKVRAEKQQILEHTLSSVSDKERNSADCNDLHKTTGQQYQDQPPISKSVKERMIVESQPVSSTEVSQAENLPLEKHKPTSGSRDSGIASRPITAQGLHSDMEPQSTASSKTSQRPKPPACINRYIPNLIEDDVAHELSTILELDTPGTSRVTLVAGTSHTRKSTVSISPVLVPSCTEYAKMLNIDLSKVGSAERIRIQKEYELLKEALIEADETGEQPKMSFPIFEEYIKMLNLNITRKEPPAASPKSSNRTTQIREELRELFEPYVKAKTSGDTEAAVFPTFEEYAKMLNINLAIMDPNESARIREEYNAVIESLKEAHTSKSVEQSSSDRTIPEECKEFFEPYVKAKATGQTETAFPTFQEYAKMLNLDLAIMDQDERSRVQEEYKSVIGGMQEAQAEKAAEPFPTLEEYAKQSNLDPNQTECIREEYKELFEAYIKAKVAGGPEKVAFPTFEEYAKMLNLNLTLIDFENCERLREDYKSFNQALNAIKALKLAIQAFPTFKEYTKKLDVDLTKMNERQISLIQEQHKELFRAYVKAKSKDGCNLPVPIMSLDEYAKKMSLNLTQKDQEEVACIAKEYNELISAITEAEAKLRMPYEKSNSSDTSDISPIANAKLIDRLTSASMMIKAKKQVPNNTPRDTESVENESTTTSTDSESIWQIEKELKRRHILRGSFVTPVEQDNVFSSTGENEKHNNSPFQRMLLAEGLERISTSDSRSGDFERELLRVGIQLPALMRSKRKETEALPGNTSSSSGANVIKVTYSHSKPKQKSPAKQPKPHISDDSSDTGHKKLNIRDFLAKELQKHASSSSSSAGSSVDELLKRQFFQSIIGSITSPSPSNSPRPSCRKTTDRQKTSTPITTDSQEASTSSQLFSGESRLSSVRFQKQTTTHYYPKAKESDVSINAADNKDAVADASAKKKLCDKSTRYIPNPKTASHRNLDDDNDDNLNVQPSTSKQMQYLQVPKNDAHNSKRS